MILIFIYRHGTYTYSHSMYQNISDMVQSLYNIHRINKYSHTNKITHTGTHIQEHTAIYTLTHTHTYRNTHTYIH